MAAPTCTAGGLVREKEATARKWEAAVAEAITRREARRKARHANR